MCLCLPREKDETKKGVCAIKGALRMRSAEPSQRKRPSHFLTRLLRRRSGGGGRQVAAPPPSHTRKNSLRPPPPGRSRKRDSSAALVCFSTRTVRVGILFICRRLVGCGKRSERPPASSKMPVFHTKTIESILDPVAQQVSAKPPRGPTVVGGDPVPISRPVRLHGRVCWTSDKFAF